MKCDKYLSKVRLIQKNTCKYKKATKNDTKTKTSTTKTAQKKKKTNNKKKNLFLPLFNTNFISKSDSITDLTTREE
jgi:hypothetical protein